MASSPGRNEPCPCGSGRKFKHCCLARQDGEDAVRHRIRVAEARLLQTVFEFALKRWGDPLFHHAWAEFWLYDDVPEDMLAEPEFDSMFVPWFAFGFVADPEAEQRTSDWPVDPLGYEWLMKGDGPQDDDDRKYVIQACRSPMSVFAIEAVEPGQSLDLQDILTGRRFHVRELTASRALRVNDLVFSKVVTIEGTSVMFGMAPYPAPPTWHTHVIDFRESLVKRRLLTRAELEQFDGEIRSFYLHVRDTIVNPAMPQVRNSDGEPLRFVALSFDLSVPVADAYARLLPLATLDGEVHDQNVVRDAAGAVTAADLVWMNRSGRASRPTTRRRAPPTVLGVLTLADGRLSAEVNSEERAAALQRQVAKRLGPDVTLVDRRVSDVVAEAFAKAQGKGRKGLRLVDPPRVVEPERAAIEAAVRAQHWQEWLDMPVPALKGKTPRQAARSASGRERLEALLRGASREPVAATDDEIAFLRAALKLSE